ncbi:MAG: hypothetical protein HYU66_17695 [Armatimonadetes bacterium]|nr:hypothetical protein [Armatimonadota bacterium]
MFELPPVPSWERLHPLVVHFPIALLMVAPVLIVLGLIRPRNRHPYHVAAFAIMLLGVLGAWLALETGEAAAQEALSQHLPGFMEALTAHENAANLTEPVFAGLTFLFGLLVFLPLVWKKAARPKLLAWLMLGYLLLYGAGMVMLTQTGHRGARLVHEVGVRAWK